MKGIIRNKHIFAVIAIIAALACLVGVMQIRRLPSENTLSGVVYESGLDQWKDSGYARITLSGTGEELAKSEAVKKAYLGG